MKIQKRTLERIANRIALESLEKRLEKAEKQVFQLSEFVKIILKGNKRISDQMIKKLNKFYNEKNDKYI
jgi:hypothetical protein